MSPPLLVAMVTSSSAPRSRLRIILRRLLVVSTLATGTAGCGVKQLEPPAAPAHTVPVVPGLPEDLPAAGNGRLLLATGGDEPAMVSRVLETIEGAGSSPTVQSGGWGASLASDTRSRRTVPLCLTPCAADLPIGAHSLVFTSLRDAQTTSVALVGVSRGSTAVRHELGHEKPFGVPYAVGVMSTLAGAGLLVVGGAALAAGLTAEPTVGASGPESDPKAVTAFGGVTAGVGLVTLAVGVVMLVANQPAHRPGATTTFPLAPSPL